MAVVPLIAAGIGKSAATAAVTTAAIGAGSQLAGGYLQSRGNNKAAQQQERARREALAYQRQKDAAELQERRAAWDNYERAYREWHGRFGDEGIKRYGVATGVNLNPAPAAGATPGAAPSATPGPAAAPVQGGPAGTGGSLVDLMGPAPQPAAEAQPAGQMAMAAPTGVPLGGAPPAGAPLGSMSPQSKAPAGTMADLGGWEDWRRYA